MFLQGSVCPQGGWGYLSQCMLGYHTHPPRSRPPLGADTPPNPSRADPPGADTPRADTPLHRHPQSRHPLGADIPRSRHPPGADIPQSRHPPKQTPPGADPPADTLQQTPPPGANTPPPGETATAADCTHPTGMHSCFKKATLIF